MGEGSFTGAEMTPAELHHQGSPQSGGQVTKAGNLHIVQPAHSSED